MRISTAELYRQAVSQMQQQQLALSKIQQQISTGLRLRTAADDPAAHSRILNLEAGLGDIDRMGENAGFVNQRLALLDDTLGELNSYLMRLRELAVQSNSGTLDATQLKHIQTEVMQVQDAILQLSNRQDGDGTYLFSGNDQAASPPFSRVGQNVAYSGDQGLRQLEVAPGQFITENIPGSELFQRITSGSGGFRVREVAGASGSAVLTGASLTNAGTWNGGPYTLSFTDPANYEIRDAGNNLVAAGAYTPGESIDVQGIRLTLEGAPAAGDSFVVESAHKQDLFSTVQQFSDALVAGGDSARLSNAIYGSLEDLDQAINHINDQRALVGSRLNTADAAQSTHDALSLHYKNSLSQLKDLDYAEASAELAQQLTALQAAQATFTRVQGLSLFNFLN